MWLALTLACPTPDADVEVPVEVGVPVLGAGQGAAGVTIEVKVTADDGLNVPRDLAFDPETGTLWIVNRKDDSVTLVFAPGTAEQTTEHRIDPYALHFMEEVSSIAFGAPGTFGTCQESRNTYNRRYPPNNFMGPTLWPSDLDVFAHSNPEAVEFLTEQFGFYTDLGSHLDMLHEDPLCMGIAWDHDNVYWVFDGYNQVIARNDFKVDHGPGFDDHSDGEIRKYLGGDIGYLEDVHAGLVLDHDTGLLYVADPANSRVLVLDTATGEDGQRLRSTEGYPVHVEMEGETWRTLVDAEDGLVTPSGLALRDGRLFVSDNDLGEIVAFDLDGEEIDRLAVGTDPGALMGFEFDASGALWFTDATNHTVSRVTAR